MVDPGKAPKMTFPARYFRPTTSGLVYDIVAGENEINIDLDAK